MTTAPASLATDLAETAAARPASIAATFNAANRELTASGSARGLDIGQHAPHFTLPDQLGRIVSLGEQLARGPVVPVFYRGDWCPFCNLALRALQGELEAIRGQGAELVAVSPQAPDHGLTLTDKLELEFPVPGTFRRRPQRRDPGAVRRRGPYEADGAGGHPLGAG